MIELKSYTVSELSAYLQAKSKQSIERKLARYDILYTEEGQSLDTIFTITEIKNPFKVYCVFDLSFGPTTDFNKLRNFCYCFLNDDEFRAMPHEVKETRMRKLHKDISRQTIATYEKRLSKLEWFAGIDYIHYFANKDEQIISDKDTYCKAWREYFEDMNNYGDWYYAIEKMKANYGGVAKKHAKLSANAFYLKEINNFNDMVCNTIIAEESI